MQERRYRPGDVLDDYCPRERRITDHAIVAMIDDEIRRTRCGSCDAEHEYKAGKAPAPRRKTQPTALFTQVLDNIAGATPRPQPPAVPADAAGFAESEVEDLEEVVVPAAVPPPVAAVAAPAPSVAAAAPAEAAVPEAPDADRVDVPELEGGFRRSLIRATFPRPEGQAPTQRTAPEFTIQSLHNRRNNNQRNAGGNHKFRGGRRRPGGGSMDNIGPMRFRDHGHGQDRPPGQGNGGGGRRRRGRKKNH